MSTVHTEIVRPDQADARPISVLWRVGRQGELYKVLDVVVQGASMSLTLQKEFTAIVRNKGSVADCLKNCARKQPNSIKPRQVGCSLELAHWPNSLILSIPLVI